MSRRSRSAGSAAMAAWNRLAPEQQYEAVRTAAHELTRTWPRWLSRNVVRFAFGGRCKGKQIRPDSPTLVVVVEKKLSKASLARSSALQPIPSHVLVKLKHKGRLTEVAVPTDVVSEVRRPRAQSLDGLQMESLADGSTIKGSIAALVRDQQDSGERYFLTCHHVACLSLFDPNLQAHLPAEATSFPGGDLIGTTEREAFFGRNVGPCIDAALVRIDDEAADLDLSLPSQAIDFVDSAAHLQAEATAGIFLFSRHKPDGEPAQLRRVHVNFDINYGPGTDATMVEAMEYELSGAQTRSGDSGGALVSGNGVFMGMHIAGAGRLGFGIPAYLLLESVAFDPPITLVV